MIDWKHWRERRGWTAGQAAEYLGVTAASVRNWEAGRRVPPDSVLRLVNVLDTVETLAPELHAAFMPGDAARPGRRKKNR